MNGYSKKVESIIHTIPTNKIIVAGELYVDRFKEIPELTYYKIMERLTKKGELNHLTKGIYYRPLSAGVESIKKEDIIDYYVADLQGVVVGYDLYNEIGITTISSLKSKVLSTKLNEENKNIGDVKLEKITLELNKDRVLILKILDILQNYNNIEDLNEKALMRYLSYFLKFYSDEAAKYVIENRKYKKSTIAFLVNLLEKLNIKHSLDKYLSPLSNYKIPILKKEGKDMPDNIAEVINGFSSDIIKMLGDKLSKIILYGSYARGDYRDNSDVDIMILVNMPEEEIVPYQEKIYDIAFEIEMDSGVDISPIIEKNEHFEYWVDALPFFRNISNEGIVLNG